MKKLYVHFVVFTLLLLAYSNVSAQYNFEFIKDIRVPQGGSSPKYFTEYDGKLYFVAYEDTYGEELWVTDGTTGGTQLFKDVNPGPVGGNPNFLTVMNHMLYFTGWDPTTGSHLWKTNGAPSGTEAVTTGDACTNIYYVTVYNNKLYFSAFDNEHGSELWVSDGSAGGTHMVKDINTRTDNGNGRTDDGSPSRFKVYNNLLYFAANDGVNGNELWVTDGTEMGTHMVKDINPGKPSSAIIYPTVFGDKMFFSAENGVDGVELWVTNGSEGGTQLFKEIWVGPNGTAPNNLFVLNDKMYFGASDSNGHGFWMSDGTSDGTVLLKKTTFFHFGDDKSHMAALNNKVYFRANDGYYGDELWTSDGTPEGTFMLKDLYPGPSGGCNFSSYAVYNNELYFIGTNADYSGTLFVTNGTEAGTKMITPNDEQGAFQASMDFLEFKGSLFFQASFDERSLELWKLTSIITAISPLDIDIESVYPNPAGSVINVTPCPKEKYYKIINAEGKEVLSGETSSLETCTINVSSLAPGLYLLRFPGRSYKFIKH